MNRHLLILANGFRTVGLVLGIPSLLACLSLTVLKLQLAWLKPDKPVSADPVNISRDGIIGILTAFGNVVGKGLEFFNNAAGWVAGLLDVAALALTVAGACIFLTGRGLALHATWARFAAGAAASAFLLISFLALTSLRRGAAFALIPLAISIYMLWVLIRKFNP